MFNLHAFSGIETTITATPTKAGQPSNLYSEMNANVICELNVRLWNWQAELSNNKPGMDPRWK